MIREGSFVLELAPWAVMLAGPTSFRAGPDGAAVARFGFADYDSGLVTNTRTDARQQLGWILPVINGVTAVAVHRGVAFARPGVGLTLLVSGNLWARFEGGAMPGQRVYASQVDGAAISGEADAAEATPWYVVTEAAPGGLAVISTTTRVM